MLLWSLLIVVLVICALSIVAYPFLSSSYTFQARVQKRIKKLKSERQEVYRRLSQLKDGQGLHSQLVVKAAELLAEEERLTALLEKGRKNNKLPRDKK